MACAITITDVRGNPDDRSVTVEGTVEECGSDVLVELMCLDTTIGPETATRIGSNRWTHTFPDTSCQCGAPIVVTAWCVEDTLCEHRVSLDALPCPEPCPICRLEARVDTECYAGRRRIHFTATITNTTGATVVASVEYEPGSSSRPIVVDPGVTITAPPPDLVHDYTPPGPPTPRLIITSPPGCPDVELEIPIGPLPTCCPVDIVVIKGECNPDGTRNVSFDFGGDYTITEARYGDGTTEAGFRGRRLPHGYPPTGGTYTATFVIDGCGEIVKEVGPLDVCCPDPDDIDVIIGDCNPDGTRNVIFDFGGDYTIREARFGDGTTEMGFDGRMLPHNYRTGGTYTATFVIDGCGEIVKEVGPLDVCCPSSDDIELMIGECNPDGTRNVTMDFGGEYTISELDWGDGSAAEVDFTAMSRTHPYRPAGSPYTISIKIEGCDELNKDTGILEECPSTLGVCCLPDGSCEELTQAECLEKSGRYMGDGTRCDEADCGAPGRGGCSLGPCGALLVTAVTMLIIGGVLVILGVCLTIPWLSVLGAVLAGVGLLLFIVWVIVCSRFTPCSVMQTVHCILFWIVAVIAPIIVLLAALFGGLPCLLAAAGAWGGWGALYAWLGFVMREVGCPKTCG